MPSHSAPREPASTTPDVYFPANGHVTGSLFTSEVQPDRNGQNLDAPEILHLHPRLRWHPVVAAVTFEVQMTRECTHSSYADCAFNEPELDTSISASSIEDETFRPEFALPVNIPRDALSGPGGSRYFWRVRACPEIAEGADHDTACWDWSETRYLFVGRDDHDYNGDGYADLIVGATGTGWHRTTRLDVSGGVFIYYGGEDGIDESPNVELSPGAGYEGLVYGHSVSSGRDINGDGYADVLVGAIGRSSGDSTADTGAVFVHLGSADGPSTEPDFVLRPSEPDAHFAWVVVGAGDLNGDGYADIAVGSAGSIENGEVPTGRVFIYEGSVDGPSETPSIVLDNPHDNPAGGSFGFVVDGGGDVDGDGLVDLIVGAPGQFGQLARSGRAGERVGAAYVYFGSVDGLSAESILAIENPDAQDGGQFGQGVACDGDFDGDGYADVLVAAPTQRVDQRNDEGRTLPGVGATYIELGRAELSGRPVLLWDWAWRNADVDLIERVTSILKYVGDLAGIGSDGFAQHANHFAAETARITVRQEVTNGAGRGLRLPREEHASHFGYAITGVDHNADGLTDLAVSDALYGESEQEGRVYLFESTAWANSSLVTTLTSPVRGPFRFGASLD